MDRDLVLKAVIGLSIIGLAVATFQTYEHYFMTSAVCDFSSTFSCSTVTESRFGYMPPGSGLPVALLGAFWWIGLLGLSYTLLQGKELIPHHDFGILAYNVFGFGFVLYLLTVELYILPQEIGQVVICPFCTIQHVLIIAVLMLSYFQLEDPVTDYVTDIFYTEVEADDDDATAAEETETNVDDATDDDATGDS